MAGETRSWEISLLVGRGKTYMGLAHAEKVRFTHGFATRVRWMTWWDLADKGRCLGDLQERDPKTAQVSRKRGEEGMLKIKKLV